MANPTAQQSEALTQLTPERSLSRAALVLGLSTINQPVRFHCSVRVWKAVSLLVYPTAQQSEALTQLRPKSSLSWVALVLGLGTIAHLSSVRMPQAQLRPGR